MSTETAIQDLGVKTAKELGFDRYYGVHKNSKYHGVLVKSDLVPWGEEKWIPLWKYNYATIKEVGDKIEYSLTIK